MLKITSHKRNQSVYMTVEGRLGGPWVNELDRAWRRIHGSEQGALVVDLTGVTFIEENGKVLLRRMWQDGAELIATGCCNRTIVDHIRGMDSSAPSDQGRGKKQ